MARTLLAYSLTLPATLIVEKLQRYAVLCQRKGGRQQPGPWQRPVLAAPPVQQHSERFP